jgi:hypothetical protein
MGRRWADGRAARRPLNSGVRHQRRSGERELLAHAGRGGAAARAFARQRAGDLVHLAALAARQAGLDHVDAIEAGRVADGVDDHGGDGARSHGALHDGRDVLDAAGVDEAGDATWAYCSPSHGMKAEVSSPTE